jgi:hypothetical protein
MKLRFDFVKIRALCLVVCALFFFMSSAICAEFVERSTAVVRVMNKAAGKTSSVSLPVGKTEEIEKLSVLARACKQTAPYDAENFYMFVEIKKGGAVIFSGWMDRNEPGDNPLQDADYDLWLVGCE